MTNNMTTRAIRENYRKGAEIVLRDWAQVDGWSSALLRTEAQNLVVYGDLTDLDPLLREKLVEISRTY